MLIKGWGERSPRFFHRMTPHPSFAAQNPPSPRGRLNLQRQVAILAKSLSRKRLQVGDPSMTVFVSVFDFYRSGWQTKRKPSTPEKAKFTPRLFADPSTWTIVHHSNPSSRNRGLFSETIPMPEGSPCGSLSQIQTFARIISPPQKEGIILLWMRGKGRQKPQ